MSKIMQSFRNLLIVAILVLAMPLSVSADEAGETNEADGISAGTGTVSLSTSEPKVDINLRIFDITEGEEFGRAHKAKPGHVYQFVVEVKNYSSKIFDSPQVTLNLAETLPLDDSIYATATIIDSSDDRRIFSDFCELRFGSSDLTAKLPSNAIPYLKLNRIEGSGQCLHTFNSDGNVRKETSQLDVIDLFTAHKGYTIPNLSRETGSYTLSCYVEAELDYSYKAELETGDIITLIIFSVISFVAGLAVMAVCINKPSSSKDTRDLDDLEEGDDEYCQGDGAPNNSREYKSNEEK